MGTNTIKSSILNELDKYQYWLNLTIPFLDGLKKEAEPQKTFSIIPSPLRESNLIGITDNIRYTENLISDYICKIETLNQFLASIN